MLLLLVSSRLRSPSPVAQWGNGVCALCLIPAGAPYTPKASIADQWLSSMRTYWSLVFDSRPITEFSLRPSEMSTRCTSSAAIANIFWLRLLQQLDGTAPSAMSAPSEIGVSRPSHQNNAIYSILIGAAREIHKRPVSIEATPSFI